MECEDLANLWTFQVSIAESLDYLKIGLKFSMRKRASGVKAISPTVKFQITFHFG